MYIHPIYIILHWRLSTVPNTSAWTSVVNFPGIDMLTQSPNVRPSLGHTLGDKVNVPSHLVHTRGHETRYTHMHCNASMYSQTFFPTAVRLWNSLPITTWDFQRETLHRLPKLTANHVFLSCFYPDARHILSLLVGSFVTHNVLRMWSPLRGTILLRIESVPAPEEEEEEEEEEEARSFNFGTRIDLGKSHLTDDKIPPKWACPWAKFLNYGTFSIAYIWNW